MGSLLALLIPHLFLLCFLVLHVCVGMCVWFFKWPGSFLTVQQHAGLGLSVVLNVSVNSVCYFNCNKLSRIFLWMKQYSFNTSMFHPPFPSVSVPSPKSNKCVWSHSLDSCNPNLASCIFVMGILGNEIKSKRRKEMMKYSGSPFWKTDRRPQNLIPAFYKKLLLDMKRLKKSVGWAVNKGRGWKRQKPK